MKKLLALTLTLCMVLALCACGGSSTASNADSGTTAAADSGKTYRVSIQFSFPEESADGAKKVMAEIEEESGGRIQFEPYYSYSFVDAGDVIDALETNQLDIAGFMTSEHPAEFPLNGAMMSLPLLNFPGWTASSQIWLSMLYNNADMMAEFTNNGMVFYAGYMCPGYQFYSTKEITDTSPSAFSGLTVMCDQAQMASFINQNAGGAISAFPPDYLSNLQNGVADALVQHVNCAYAFGCFDYIKSAIFFGESGFYNLPLAYAFSETFWNSLPSDLQDIFAAHAAEFCYESQMSDEALYSNVAYPILAEKANIIVLSDDEIATWQSAVAPIVDSALSDIANDSPNANATYLQLKDMIENYDAATFQIGTNNFGLPATWGN
jgi:TRAP-type C4-dicarboxylate transport system substrate-binding protein